MLRIVEENSDRIGVLHDCYWSLEYRILETSNPIIKKELQKNQAEIGRSLSSLHRRACNFIEITPRIARRDFSWLCVKKV
jgi:hypothetical protein